MGDRLWQTGQKWFVKTNPRLDPVNNIIIICEPFFVIKANSGGVSAETIGCAACRCWTRCRRKTFGCQLWVLGNAIFLRIHGHESENNELHGNDFQHVRRGGGTSAKIWCRIMWGWGASVSRWWMRMMHYFQKMCRNPNKNIGKVNVRNYLRCFRRNTSNTSQSLCRKEVVYPPKMMLLRSSLGYLSSVDFEQSSWTSWAAQILETSSFSVDSSCAVHASCRFLISLRSQG